MKIKKSLRIIYAWVLLVTLMGALSVKDFHIHPQMAGCDDHATAAHHATVQADCYVCDFVMQPGDVVKPVVFIPVTTVTLLARHVFAVQTVYRPVMSINSHSPPAVA